MDHFASSNYYKYQVAFRFKVRTGSFKDKLNFLR